MKKILVVLAGFLLAGCGGRNAMDVARDNVKTAVETQNKAIESLEKNLPAECKSAGVVAELNVLRAANQNIGATADTMVSICAAETDNLNIKIKNRDLIIAGLLIVLFLMVRSKIIGFFKEV